MDLEIRPIEPDEIAAYARAEHAAFGQTLTDEQIETGSVSVEVDRTLAVFDAGSIVATAGANVSVRRPGDPYGTRCEVKNMNSTRSLGRAIEYEARRQAELLEAGSGSCRRPATGTRTRGAPPPSAPRRRRTTTATSPCPTSCPWCPTPPGWRT